MEAHLVIELSYPTPSFLWCFLYALLRRWCFYSLCFACSCFFGLVLGSRITSSNLEKLIFANVVVSLFGVFSMYDWKRIGGQSEFNFNMSFCLWMVKCQLQKSDNILGCFPLAGFGSFLQRSPFHLMYWINGKIDICYAWSHGYGDEVAKCCLGTKWLCLLTIKGS